MVILVTGMAMAQSDSLTAKSSGSSSALRFSGEIGAFGELYNMSGRPDNRPSSTGRVFLRSTLTAWESISTNLNLVLSTEGNSARQEINQLDFNPRWRWGEMHLGDFTTEYTPLTLNGIRVRGGSLMLQPGKFRLGLLSGRTNRSVSTDSDRRSYERTISGGVIGIGQTQGSHFNLTFLTARDRLGSLADIPTDTTIDTLGIGDDSTQNPVSVTPQENLVVSALTNLKLFDRHVTWRSEFSASAITRDRRADPVESEDIPAFLADIFTPRVSSGADYAYTTDLNLDLKKVAFTAGYKYIGPGYVSLGVTSLLPDRQTVSAGMQYRHSRGMFKLDGSHQTDNLIDQKLATTTRTRFSSVLTYRLARGWNANAAVTVAGMQNDAAVTSSKVDYTSLMLRTGQIMTFSRRLGLKMLSLDYTYQHAEDPTPGRQTSRLASHSATLGSAIGLTESLELTAQSGLVSSERGDSPSELSQTYALGLRKSALQARLMLSATTTIAVQSPHTSFRNALRGNYRLTQTLSMTAEVETTLLRGGPSTNQYEEIASRLMVTRQF